MNDRYDLINAIGVLKESEMLEFDGVVYIIPEKPCLGDSLVYYNSQQIRFRTGHPDITKWDKNAYLPFLFYNGRFNQKIFEKEVRDIIIFYTNIMRQLDPFRERTRSISMSEDVLLRIAVSMIFSTKTLTKDEQIFWSDWLKHLYKVRIEAEVKAYVKHNLPF